jgi:hypothetical protein
VKHGQHHFVAALGGCCESEAQTGEKGCLHHTEAIVAPTGVEVVIRYAITK